MDYRSIPGTDERISVIGLGANYAYEDYGIIPRLIETSIKNGINLFDTVTLTEAALSYYAKELSHYDRKDYKLQIHFGTDYVNNQYCWTRNLDRIKMNTDRQISMLGCGYTDFGLVHCIDTEEDYNDVFYGGLWDYILSLQREGVIKYVGCSTHNPVILRKFIETGKIKMAMFSINMVYDYLSLGNYAIGTLEDRYSLYEKCKNEKIGITVMKPYAGKRLLFKNLNSFGEAFSVTQCIQYALDRPAVISVLPGIANEEELMQTLHYLDTTEEERDYSKVYGLGRTRKNADHDCVYCNHCLPCPAGINIGLVNKYYDLAKIGDEVAADHYEKMAVKADACLKCGHCNSACPFHVSQMNRMDVIDSFFSAKRSHFHPKDKKEK